MAIEISPSQEAKKTDWAIILLYLLSALFLISTASFFVLSYYSQKIENEIKNVEQKLTKTSQEDALEKEIILASKQIEDWSKLVDSHAKTSNIFDFLEKNTHPKVWFSNFRMTTAQNLVLLEGQAENFESLGQQLMFFKGQQSLKEVELSGISLDREGKVGFSLRLVFDPSIFK